MSRLAQVLRPALTWAYRRPGLFPLTTDLLAWCLGLIVGAVLKLVFSVGTVPLDLLVVTVAAVTIQLLVGSAVGLYSHRWRVSSFDEVTVLGAVWAVTSTIIVVGNNIARRIGSDLNTSAVIMGSLATLLLMGLVRGVWRRFWEKTRRPDIDACKRTIVFGAGEGGAQMMRAMLLNANSVYFPVALLDDDPSKAKRELDGVRVMGTRADIQQVANRTKASVLLVAIPSATSKIISDLTELAVSAGLEVRVLPATAELVGQVSVADARPPTVDDLLGRDPVEIDLDSVANYIRGKRVLITGAGGSIGSELSQQVAGFEPSKLFLLDHDESGLHAVQLAIEGRALLDSEMLVVADIRDRERIFEVFDELRPEVVFHAAALKHLTLLENHPGEGVKTNTIGTMNVLDASVATGAERFVNISTDKAADPSCVLGATKLAAERMTALTAEATGLPFVSVRFGNVLGSRGSVLPTFMGQLEQGAPVTVTDPEVTRYFMTIPEAVRLVIQAGAIGRAGEVMILDMGEPVKILDMANQLIRTLRPGHEIEFTGLRPGEKLHEVLISIDEVAEPREHERILHTEVELADPAAALSSGDRAHLVRAGFSIDTFMRPTLTPVDARAVS
ncbi:MAG: nucleoside-diphosphate sugar epimerase/dehydratase [Acidimicrobiia bacterium]|nr:nucleoside-diphosphate sugar epimerase/dehydratase [Acidimicrobiia bacterium]